MLSQHGSILFRRTELLLDDAVVYVLFLPSCFSPSSAPLRQPLLVVGHIVEQAIVGIASVAFDPPSWQSRPSSQGSSYSSPIPVLILKTRTKTIFAVTDCMVSIIRGGRHPTSRLTVATNLRQPFPSQQISHPSMAALSLARDSSRPRFLQTAPFLPSSRTSGQCSQQWPHSPLCTM